MQLESKAHRAEGPRSQGRPGQPLAPLGVIETTRRRQTGVLLPVSALPSPWGIGDLGTSARAMVDWLANAGVSTWQILPLCPTDLFGSPYSSWADFAGSPLLLDMQPLVEVGLLTVDELPELGSAYSRVDYAGVASRKGGLLERAARRFVSQKDHGWKRAYVEYCVANPWLEEYAAFVVLRDLNNGLPWWEWPSAHRDCCTSSLGALRKEYALEFETAIAIQFFFDEQWGALRGYCESKGIALLGDLPFYVSANSVDVWMNQDQFLLDEHKRPAAVAGTPPDALAEDGQFWGNPIYNWELMEEGGYCWWKDRLSRAFARYHRVRLDHFRGFSAYWEIPAGSETAAEGRWVDGPGVDFTNHLTAHFESFPVVVEDLGDIDQDVRDLVGSLGVPGMKVLQFAFGSDSDSEHLPFNYTKNCICFTGTHDTNTLLGWWTELDESSRNRVRCFLGSDGGEIVWELIRLALSSVAELAVIPMQDLFGLDSAARMNTPGTTTNNWAWRLPHEPDSSIAERLKSLSTLYGR